MAALLNRIRRCSKLLNVGRYSYTMQRSRSRVYPMCFMSDSAQRRSKVSYVYGFNGQQGQRSEMQDAMYHNSNFNVGEQEYCVFGVFDGHGHDLCSKFLADNIASYLSKNITKHSTMERAFKATMSEMDTDFNAQNKGYRHVDIGSTACIALIDKNAVVPQIYVSNVGDSRCVLVDSAANGFVVTPLSVDHHPNSNEFERKRLLALKNPKITSATIAANEYFGLTLAMSRCIGDDLLKKRNKNVYTAEPDIVQHAINDGNKYLLVFSDGFTFQNEEIQNIFERIYVNEYGLAENNLNELCYRLISYGINGTFNNGYDEEIGKSYMKLHESLDSEDLEYRQKFNWLFNYFKNDVKKIGYVLKICVFDFDDERKFAILEDLVWPYELEEGVFDKIKDLFSCEKISERIDQLDEENKKELKAFVEWMNEAKQCKGAKTMDDVSLIIVKLDNDSS